MSTEDFRNLINTIDRNLLAKEKLLQCKTSEDLILLAKKYLYAITF